MLPKWEKFVDRCLYTVLMLKDRDQMSRLVSALAIVGPKFLLKLEQFSGEQCPNEPDQMNIGVEGCVLNLL